MIDWLINWRKRRFCQHGPHPKIGVTNFGGIMYHSACVSKKNSKNLLFCHMCFRLLYNCCIIEIIVESSELHCLLVNIRCSNHLHGDNYINNFVLHSENLVYFTALRQNGWVRKSLRLLRPQRAEAYYSWPHPWWWSIVWFFFSIEMISRYVLTL